MCFVISLVVSFLVLTRSVLSLILTPVLVIKQQMLGQVWKQDITYIFFPSALSTWSFLPPCTYTAPNVFGGYCPAKREAPAYTMHGRNFAPLPQTGTVTEYLVYCTTSSLHQTKEVLFPIRGSVIETVSYTVNCWISHALVCVSSSHHLALFPAWEC